MNVHKIEIDAKAGSAYVYVERPTPGGAARQVNVGDALVLDFAKDGTLVGIEVLHPDITAMLMEERTLEQFRSARIPVSVA